LSELESPEARVRARAAAALASIIQVDGSNSDERIVPGLPKATRDEDQGVRNAAITGLGRMASSATIADTKSAALDTLLPLLDSPDAGTRRAAVQALMVVRDERVLAAMRRAEEDEDLQISAPARGYISRAEATGNGGRRTA